MSVAETENPLFINRSNAFSLKQIEGMYDNIPEETASDED